MYKLSLCVSDNFSLSLSLSLSPSLCLLSFQRWNNPPMQGELSDAEVVPHVSCILPICQEVFPLLCVAHRPESCYQPVHQMDVSFFVGQ